MTQADPREDISLPLEGVRVVEFTHMVMGPSGGMIFGDLGAEVIKVEPPRGDNTRRLIGAGAGFFRMFNRNKKSVAIDMATADGLALARKLVATADVVSENFKPGLMAKYGLDYATLAKEHPRLIYVSHKGFLPGPYEHRTALDEVVQMMGGLAYMTGPPGRPLRAGSSVNDIMGGMFGVIGALAAMRERDRTGRGQEIQTALFENCALLVGQSMQQFAATGTPARPMPDREPAWAIYDIFEAKGGTQVFLGVVTDGQWKVFCEVFGLPHLLSDPRLKSNNQRVTAREWLLPELQSVFSCHGADELQRMFEANGLPFAPIIRPDQMFEDPHLTASGGLGELVTDTGDKTQVPLLPITVGRRRFKPRLELPVIGEHTAEVLRDLGCSAGEIADLARRGIIVTGRRPSPRERAEG